MKVLVTGANGFVAKHLILELLNRNHEVIAGVRDRNLEGPIGVKKVYLDVTDSKCMETILKEMELDSIVHLAAQSKINVGWNLPVATFEVNTLGTIQLVQLISEFSPRTKLITVGSSEEYGISGKYHEIINESVPCLPQNPYASSKLAAGEVCLQLAKKNNISLLHVRPFNHFGPGQAEGFVMSDFSAQIARIEYGLTEPVIYVGDLSSQRDFTDVRDIVRAYSLLVESDAENGIYNISSGIPRKIKDILLYLINISTCDIKIQVDPNKFRPSEVPIFIGDYSKISNTVNWTPEIDFYDSLKETLNWWRVITKGN